MGPECITKISSKVCEEKRHGERRWKEDGGRGRERDGEGKSRKEEGEGVHGEVSVTTQHSIKIND
jgi:hypothetical protein